MQNTHTHTHPRLQDRLGAYSQEPPFLLVPVQIHIAIHSLPSILPAILSRLHPANFPRSSINIIVTGQLDLTTNKETT